MEAKITVATDGHEEEDAIRIAKQLSKVTRTPGKQRLQPVITANWNKQRKSRRSLEKRNDHRKLSKPHVKLRRYEQKLRQHAL